jgi:cyanate permease
MNAFEILSRVIEISNAPVDVDRRLKNLVDMLAHHFSLSVCALFLWHPQRRRLLLQSWSSSPRSRVELMATPMAWRVFNSAIRFLACRET